MLITVEKVYDCTDAFVTVNAADAAAAHATYNPLNP